MVIHGSERFSIELKISAFLVLITTFSFMTLTLPRTLAQLGPSTDVVDEIEITVPISCSMSSTISSEHASEVNNGQTVSDIGTTNLKVICNDNSGYAIYAIGYTDDTYGKTVLTNPAISSTNDIITSTTVTTGTSSWAMKLTAVSGTYTPIIAGSTGDSLKQTGDPDFSDYTAVPEEYTKVAYHTASTDTGTNATGSNLTTTYRAYISPSQPAGTYIGQVKYTLVHPSYVDNTALEDAVTVVFNGNGLTFPDGSTTNTVKYANVCEPGEYIYAANTPSYTFKTSNLNNDGTQNQNSPYTDSEYILETRTLTGADKVKVVVDYGITGDTAELSIVNAAWDGDWDNWNYDWESYDIYYDYNTSGTKTYMLNGDTVTIYADSWAIPESNYDYGFYAKIYPVYDTEQADTTRIPINCSVMPISGVYKETSTWNGKWTAVIDGLEVVFNDEVWGGYTAEQYFNNYLINDFDNLKGATISLYAYNPYTLKYDGNGALNSDDGMGIHKYYAGRDSGYLPLELSEGVEVLLIASNYKRTGYGFIGWSTDQDAASHISSATIYGPNETITVDQNLLGLANNNREITLYAIWLPSNGNIQNWSGCSSMSIGNVTALTDTRDNNVYTVAKLADGNCWMVENLRLGGDSPMTLTTADTQSAGTLPANTSLWGGSDTSQNLFVNTPNTLVDNKSMRSYIFGNYYSYATTINSSESISITTNTEITTSICPAGWRLPSGTIYSDLISSLQGDSGNETSNNIRSWPNNFTLAGRKESDYWWSNRLSSYNQKTFGYYWTSSANDVNFYYYCNFKQLILHEDGVWVDHYDSDISNSEKTTPSDGLSVRCVLPSSN